MFRHLCAGDTDFYNRLESFDCDAEAGKRGIYHRYYIQICTLYTVHWTDRGGQTWYSIQICTMYSVRRVQLLKNVMYICTVNFCTNKYTVTVQFVQFNVLIEDDTVQLIECTRNKSQVRCVSFANWYITFYKGCLVVIINYYFDEIRYLLQLN